VGRVLDVVSDLILGAISDMVLHLLFPYYYISYCISYYTVSANDFLLYFSLYTVLRVISHLMLHMHRAYIYIYIYIHGVTYGIV
jgi:hypothetical protein